MARKTTPSYVVELPLATTASDLRRLDGVCDAGKRLTNAMLQDGLAIVAAIRADSAWAAARTMSRATAEQRKLRGQAFQAVRTAHGFSE